AAQAGQQTEVAAKRKIGELRGVRRHLLCFEVVGVQDCRVEMLEGFGEPAKVLLRWIRDYVEVLGHADEAVRVDGKSAHDDVLDAALVQVLEQRPWIKRVGHGGTPRRSGWRTSRARRPPRGWRSRRVFERARPGRGWPSRCERSPLASMTLWAWSS